MNSSLCPRPTAPGAIILLSLTYLFYFGQLGVLVPYLGVFLDGRGFSSEQIGELFALITLARILGPNLWAVLADKTGKGLAILRFGCFLTFATFCFVFVSDGFWQITLSFALMMMFWTAVLPQLEVLTLTTVQSDAHRYSKIRLWGSIGFILLTVITGYMIDLFSTEAPIVISAITLLALFGSTLLLPDARHLDDTTTTKGSLWTVLLSGPFIGFILSAILLQVSFGPFYGFFALYMRDLGFSGQQTGALIATGVAAEVIIFLLAGRLITLFGVKWILLISVLLTALRWALLGTMASNSLMVILTQLLHAFSFGMTHAASMHFIHHYFDKRYQSRGQALYVSLAFGIGGAIGNYAAGQLWSQGAGAHASFMFATIAALLSAACILIIPSSKMR